MKKLLSAFITLILLVSCCFIATMPAGAAGNEELQINYDDFDIVDGVIIEYLGAGGEVIIPSLDADGNEITAIDKRAFWDATTVTAVYICEGIEEIGDECFEGCVQLNEVSLPYSLTDLGYSAFRRTSVSSLVIPGQVKAIQNTLVTTVGAEEGGLGLGFTDCVISYGVEEIRSQAFYFSGTELVIPSSVALLEGSAVHRYNNSEVLEIYICGKNTEIGSLNQDIKAYLPNSMTEHTFTGSAPIALVWNKMGGFKVYGNDDADEQRRVVNEWKAQYPDATISFVGKDAELMKNKENSVCREKGITSKTKYVMSAEGGLEAEGGENANNNNNDKNNAGTANIADSWIPGVSNALVLILAFMFILIIAVVVIVVVLAGGKKKKKKKKKKAAPKNTEIDEAEAEAEPESEAADSEKE